MVQKEQKLKIVINTNYESAGTRVCVDDMLLRLKKKGHEVTRNDWDHYKNYDIAMFMAPDSEINKAKKQNSKITTVLMDPKLSCGKRIEESKKADLLIVSSIEQQDAFLKYNENIFIYYMFPETQKRKKKHEQKNKIIIGYHGNKVHLNCFKPKITWALEKLGKEYNLEFWPMYNIKKLGKWHMGRPKNIKIKDIQWKEKNYYKFLAKCDIGICNNMMPHPRIFSKILEWIPNIFLNNTFNFNNTDYVMRYKYSSNPGRIYVFNQLGIPVISDFIPSSSIMIEDNVNGIIAQSKEGWYTGLKQLIKSHELRQKKADNMRIRIDSYFSPEKTFEKFNNTIKLLNKRKNKGEFKLK